MALPEGTPIEVQVPVLAGLPMRFCGGEVVDMPAEDRVVIEPSVASFACLDRALAVARTTVAELPKTPFRAAGFDLRYQWDHTPETVSAAFSVAIDDTLSRHDRVVTARRLGRTISFGSGVVNVTISSSDEGCLAEFNFHLDSSFVDGLNTGLSSSLDEVQALVADVLQAVGVPWEEHETSNAH